VFVPLLESSAQANVIPLTRNQQQIIKRVLPETTTPAISKGL
jgi:hypothetical protein